MDAPELQDAERHEGVLWYLAAMAWLVAVTDKHQAIEESSDGCRRYYDLDLSACPCVEICDERFVRRFSVEAVDDRSVEFKLSAPIREVDPVSDETLLDHAVLVYPN